MKINFLGEWEKKKQKSLETSGFGVLWGKTYKKLSKNFQRATFWPHLHPILQGIKKKKNAHKKTTCINSAIRKLTGLAGSKQFHFTLCNYKKMPL